MRGRRESQYPNLKLISVTYQATREKIRISFVTKYCYTRGKVTSNRINKGYNRTLDQIERQMIQVTLVNSLRSIVKGIRRRNDNINCLLGDQITGPPGLNSCCLPVKVRSADSKQTFHFP